MPGDLVVGLAMKPPTMAQQLSAMGDDLCSLVLRPLPPPLPLLLLLPVVVLLLGTQRRRVSKHRHH